MVKWNTIFLKPYNTNSDTHKSFTENENIYLYCATFAAKKHKAKPDVDDLFITETFFWSSTIAISLVRSINLTVLNLYKQQTNNITSAMQRYLTMTFNVKWWESQPAV